MSLLPWLLKSFSSCPVWSFLLFAYLCFMLGDMFYFYVLSIFSISLSLSPTFFFYVNLEDIIFFIMNACNIALFYFYSFILDIQSAFIICFHNKIKLILVRVLRDICIDMHNISYELQLMSILIKSKHILEEFFLFCKQTQCSIKFYSWIYSNDIDH